MNLINFLEDFKELPSISINYDGIDPLNGIINFLFTNKFDIRNLNVTSSSFNPYNLINGINYSKYFITSQSYIYILLNNFSILPKTICIEFTKDYSSTLIFEASNNGNDWIILLELENVFLKQGKHFFNFFENNLFFNYFRLKNGNQILGLSFLEIYNNFYLKGFFYENIFINKFKHSDLGISILSEKNNPYTLINFNINYPFFTIESDNNWVQFDFINKKISLNGYSILIYHKNQNLLFINSWILIGSNDEINWFLIDEILFHEKFSNNNVISYFPVINTPYFRFIKLIQNNVNSKKKKILIFNSMELFGSISS